MLRWLYSLKRPLYIVLLVTMVGGMMFASFMPVILGQSVEAEKAFDPSLWFSTMYFGIIISVITMRPMISDYMASGFGKYIAVMPFSRTKCVSAIFIYYGLLTLVSAVICSVMPICYMICSDTFELRYLALGFTFVFCIDLFVVFMIILIEVAIGDKIVKLILSVAVVFGSMMFFTVGLNEEDEMMKHVYELLISGNYYYMALALFVVTAAVLAVIWVAASLLYKRREF